MHQESDETFEQNAEQSAHATSGDSVDTAALKTTLTKQRSIFRLSLMNDLLTVFSPAERLLLYVLTVALSVSSLALLAGANATVSTEVPARGGKIIEGLVGPARFINPVLAISAADNDLTALTYSGLVRALPGEGTVPDLAERYEISEDGTRYSFVLRENAVFHDGRRVTSADVLYTIKQIQNPDIKSPHRADWDGVEVSTPDDRTVLFTLPHAYAPFIDNATIGILPEHLWKDTSPEDFPFNPLNTHPVGSGTYRIKHVEEDSTGSATRFELVPFNDYTLGRAHIRDIVFRLYGSEAAVVKAFNTGEINAMAGISAAELAEIDRSDSIVIRSTLPRIFGVFFNQNRSALLADAAVREALDIAIDKDRLVRATLGGFATPITSPVPPMSSSIVEEHAATTTPVSTAYTLDSIDAARDALERGGWQYSQESGDWKKNGTPLSFTIATADTPDLMATANAVVTAWRQVGAKVDLKVYPLSELNTNIIRPREYDAILFGEVVGREPDLYSFWHSSQRNDPGLNLSLYANAKADTLLSQARATTDRQDRDKLYTEFADLIIQDQPAIFLYAPDFLYVFPDAVSGVRIGSLTNASERYQNVFQWYTDTERVWEIFADPHQTL